MAIFQSSVLKKYLKQLDTDTVAKAYKKYIKYFHDAAIQQNIRESKEEQYQAKFLDELFVSIFGYTLNPQPKFNLTTEFKNIQNSRKADGAILQNDAAIAVIELKGTNTKDLESIRKQAFDYKANQPECVYVITSNFEKLRFYINNAVDFEEFDLFALSYSRFELLYLCLHKDNLLQHVPLKIKESSIHEEEAITKTFYNDYSQFKRELFRDIVKRNLRNPELRELGESSSKKVLFKKTQKLLDRFLFIFFGEDRGLLPPNSIPKILADWELLKDKDAYVPLYNRYKKYFEYLNSGWKGKEYEIFAYNGGLFKPDPILDTIQIDDDLLFKHTSILTKYDFESQVDVNILGHIFEHSLNEIESVNAEIDGVEFDKQKTKRKKDGVFYTPKYITKYIVDNTVGKLCEEKKAELDIHEEEYLKGPKNRAKTTIQKLDEQLEAYRAWLLTLTICDPACGSGAFLNQALDFLILEHRWVDELSSKLHGGGFVFPDIENSILEKNIYGVDLNDESVEIAKLSLWLRTAQKGRKLTSLNSNIKCGNSLIDSKAMAGDKAFSWEKEFPEVFAKGGFDVVIGNPPYVQVKDVKQFEAKKYRTVQSGDLYAMFYEQSIRLLKPSAILGFITPSSFMTNIGFITLREELLSYNLNQLIDLGANVFKDASVDSAIVILTNDSHVNKKTLVGDDLDSLRLINQSVFNDLTNKILNIYLKPEGLDLCNKIELKFDKFGDYLDFARGVEFGFRSEHIVDYKQNDNYYPILCGGNIAKHNIKFEQKFVKYNPDDTKIYKDLRIYLDEKILIKRIGNKIIGTYDNQGYFNVCDVYNLRKQHNDGFTLKSISAIINSSLINFYYDTKFKSVKNLFPKIPIQNLKLLPFPKFDSRIDQQLDLKLSKVMDENDLIETISNRFILYIKRDLTLLAVPSRLLKWYDLNFSAFIKELNKAIKTAGGNQLSKLDEMEWMELFETKKKEALELKAEIDKTDKEIDRMVYALYGLTEEEIKIVEGV